MKKVLISIIFLMLAVEIIHAQESMITKQEQEIIDLSKQKWQWMSDKNVDALSDLFEDKCDFVHMGGTWGKTRELEIIKGGYLV